MMVVEMGANHQREIAFLCALAEPDFGYITNYGKAHLEGFGGVEGVIRGKSEMYDYLMAEGKTIFLNADDPHSKKNWSPIRTRWGLAPLRQVITGLKIRELIRLSP